MKSAACRETMTVQREVCVYKISYELEEDEAILLRERLGRSRKTDILSRMLLDSLNDLLPSKATCRRQEIRSTDIA